MQHLEIVEIRRRDRRRCAAGLGSPVTASSYSFPTKYGGEVTTSATEFAGKTSAISRPSRLWIGSILRNRRYGIIGTDLGRREAGVELRGVVLHDAPHRMRWWLWFSDARHDNSPRSNGDPRRDRLAHRATPPTCPRGVTVDRCIGIRPVTCHRPVAGCESPSTSRTSRPHSVATRCSMSSVLLELADNLTDRRGAAPYRRVQPPLLSVSTQPTGLLGIRFASVEAVAVRLGAGLVLAVHRSGEAMVIAVPTHPERRAPMTPRSSSISLAARQPGRRPPTARLASSPRCGSTEPCKPRSTHRSATHRAAALARLHPAASGVATSPELLRHRTSAAPSMQLRSDLAAGWPIAAGSAALASGSIPRSGPLRLRPATGDRHHAADPPTSFAVTISCDSTAITR